MIDYLNNFKETLTESIEKMIDKAILKSNYLKDNNDIEIVNHAVFCKEEMNI